MKVRFEFLARGKFDVVLGVFRLFTKIKKGVYSKYDTEKFVIYENGFESRTKARSKYFEKFLGST